MSRQRSLFYGWTIVAVVAVGMMLISGVRNSFSVLFPSILDEMHWDRASTAGMLSINLGMYGLIAPLGGALSTRRNPRVVMCAGLGILCFSTIGCAFAKELWHFYLLFGFLMPLGTALAGFPVLAPALVNWFVKRRGLVLGIGQMGGGLSFAYSLLVQFIINWVGWRNTLIVLAGILVAVLLPLYLFVFHYRPENRGMVALGSTLPQDSGSPTDLAASGESGHKDWTMGKAARTVQLWLLVLSGSLFWGVGCYLVLAHQVRFAEDAGYSSVLSASVFALFGVCLILGQVSGFVSDWVGREATVALGVILAAGAMLALVRAADGLSPWALYAYAISLGLGTGLYDTASITGAADIFHGKSFGGIVGLLVAGLGLGGAVGPWVGGYVHDATGSYRVAFMLAISVFVLAGVTFYLAAPRHAARLRARGTAAV